MTRGLADTSLFIARETSRALNEAAVPDELAVSAITIGELRAGVLVAMDSEARARRLVTLTQALAMQPGAVDDDVAASWATRRVMLRDRGQQMPVNDSWIAAATMALEVPVVTQDDDYPSLPRLTVIRV